MWNRLPFSQGDNSLDMHSLECPGWFSFLSLNAADQKGAHLDRNSTSMSQEPRGLHLPLRDLKDSAEELLLPKGVFWGRDRGQQWVFLGVCLTVGHQVRSRLGHLQGKAETWKDRQAWTQTPPVRLLKSQLSGPPRLCSFSSKAKDWKWRETFHLHKLGFLTADKGSMELSWQDCCQEVRI